MTIADSGCSRTEMMTAGTRKEMMTAGTRKSLD